MWNAEGPGVVNPVHTRGTIERMDKRVGTLGNSSHRRRSIRLIAALSVGLIGSSFIPQSAGGQEADEFVPGSGTAYAQIYRAGPTAGRLSLAPVIGLSLSDYLNTVGRGEVRAADWAGIGVAECSLPENTPFLKASSNTPGASEGISETTAGQAGLGGGVDMFVRATKAPLGESRFRIASLTVPGLIDAHDSEARTSAALLKTAKGMVRESKSVTEIGALDIAGIVTLKGLTWSTIQQTGATKSVKGSFTVEGLSIAGVPVPLPGGISDLKSVLDTINGALAPTGFAISLPVVEPRNGQANVSPLSLDIANSQLGRQFLAPVLAQLQEPRQPVIDLFSELAAQLVEAGNQIRGDSSSGCGGESEDASPIPGVPDLTVGILAGDLALGVFAGSAQLHIELGGVSSFTEGEVFDNPFGDVDFTPPKISPPKTVFTPGTPGTPPTKGVGPSTVQGDFASAPGIAGSKTVPGDKGGVAVAVGLVGLAVAIGLAVADWLRMRASRNMAT